MKSSDYKISLFAAILININIMLGAGIFINTAELAKRAGVLGAFGYPAVALLMLPLILSVAALLRLHPGGGFYQFGAREIAPFAGFISSWSYFVGKLASAAIMIHASVLLSQQVIPAMGACNGLFIDMMVLTCFTLLNLLNVRIGSSLQALFMGMKMVPIIFVVLLGLFFFSGVNLGEAHWVWEGLPSVMPLVLYATVGFEAACSLSSKIENAEKNAPRAVLYSFGFVVCAAFLYQLFFYGVLGDALARLVDYRAIFPAFVTAIFSGNRHVLAALLQLFAASSALGGSYGILFSNNWNLHTLAQHGHTFGSTLLRRLNAHGIPAACVVIEGAVCAFYLVVTRGNQIPLQQIAALGCVLAFLISALSLLTSRMRAGVLVRVLIPSLALVSCVVLGANCVQQLFLTGLAPFFYFAVLLTLGVGMFLATAVRSRF